MPNIIKMVAKPDKELDVLFLSEEYGGLPVILADDSGENDETAVAIIEIPCITDMKDVPLSIVLKIIDELSIGEIMLFLYGKTELNKKEESEFNKFCKSLVTMPMPSSFSFYSQSFKVEHNGNIIYRDRLSINSITYYIKNGYIFYLHSYPDINKESNPLSYLKELQYQMT